jgi:hypothetical protein
MEPRNLSRIRLSLEALDDRVVPTVLTTIPLGQQTDPAGNAQAGIIQLAANPSDARPFHLEESGVGVLDLANGKINASASGIATHLGKFTLTDESKIVGMEVVAGEVILQIDGDAKLNAANGDRLDAHFAGTVNFTTGVGTLNFEWTGGEGRFEDATGATVWHLDVNPANLTYTAVADGVINF